MAKEKKTTAANKTETKPKTVQMSAAHKVAKDLFASQKTLDEVHITSDGTAFYTLSDAKNHARTLKDKAVVSVKRSELAVSAAKEEKPATAPTDTENGNGENPTEDNEEGDNEDENTDKE